MQQSRTEKNRTANPNPPEIKDEGAQKPQRTILSSLIREEMVSLNSPPILSKIVVVLMIYDIIVFETSVFDHPHVNKRPAILKISSCYPKTPWTKAKTTKQSPILRIPRYVCPYGAYEWFVTDRTCLHKRAAYIERHLRVTMCTISWSCIGSQPSVWFSWNHLWPLLGTFLDVFWSNTYWQSCNKDASSGR